MNKNMTEMDSFRLLPDLEGPLPFLCYWATLAEKFEKHCNKLRGYLEHCFSFFPFFFFLVFRALPKAYGSSQARGRIGAVPASLHHSLSNARSKPCLWPTPQLTAILDPLSEARDWNHILMDTSQDHYHWATTGTSHSLYFKMLPFYFFVSL